MKTFYVLWTYMANYSNLREVQAESAEEALNQTVVYMSDHFKKHGKVYVFDKPPVATYSPDC